MSETGQLQSLHSQDILRRSGRSAGVGLLHSQGSFIGEKGRKVEEIVETFVLRLKRRQIAGSWSAAHNTAELMRAVVSLSAFDDVASLVGMVQALGHRLQDAQPLEFSVGNIVRRVLFIIREEARKLEASR